MKLGTILLLLFIQTAEAQEMDNLKWLEGEWVNFTENDSSYEVWRKHPDGYFEGYGLTIIKGDTVFYEELKIVEINDTLYYQARIEDQNNGEPVLFRHIENEDGYTFINFFHDFPQKIIYQPENDTLYITLEGVEENYRKKIDLFYLRRKL